MLINNNNNNNMQMQVKSYYIEHKNYENIVISATLILEMWALDEFKNCRFTVNFTYNSL